MRTAFELLRTFHKYSAGSVGVGQSSEESRLTAKGQKELWEKGVILFFSEEQEA